MNSEQVIPFGGDCDSRRDFPKGFSQESDYGNCSIHKLFDEDQYRLISQLYALPTEITVHILLYGRKMKPFCLSTCLNSFQLFKFLIFGMFLHSSHDVAAPLNPYNMEVSGYIDHNVSMAPQLGWKLEILNPDKTGFWKVIESQIRLIHVNTSTSMMVWRNVFLSRLLQ